MEPPYSRRYVRNRARRVGSKEVVGFGFSPIPAARRPRTGAPRPRPATTTTSSQLREALLLPPWRLRPGAATHILPGLPRRRARGTVACAANARRGALLGFGAAVVGLVAGSRPAEAGYSCVGCSAKEREAKKDAREAVSPGRGRPSPAPPPSHPPPPLPEGRASSPPPPIDPRAPRTQEYQARIAKLKAQAKQAAPAAPAAPAAEPEPAAE